MKSNWTIGKKLIVSFLSVACITLLLGAVGYYGVNQCGNSVDKLGTVLLPSVNSLLVISEAQTAIDGAENALLSREIDLKARQGSYERIASKWKAADDAWKVYEPLPQTTEEEATWKQFVPAWNAWKADDEAYLKLSKEYDAFVEAGFKANELYKKMTDQALVQNAKSYAPAEAFLGQIVDLYTSKAKNSDTKSAGTQPAGNNSATDRVAFLTVWSLGVIDKAQTAIDGAENALLSREITLKDRQEKYDAIAAAWKRVDDAWKVYEPLPQSPEEAEIWKKFVPAWNTWKGDDETFVKMSKEYDGYVDGYFKANELYKKMTDQALVLNAKTFAPAEDFLNKVVDINTKGADEASKSAAQQAATMKTISIAGLIVGVALAMFLGIIISRSINKALTRIITGLNEGADQVSDAAGQVSSASQQLASGASEQASSLEETSSALEEMAAMTRTNAASAKEANGLAAQARTAAQEGDQTMVKLNAAMTGINESSQKISKIIKVIEEIAFQTNLLALNAAVEAARAGEHGKGFAVVADEVRNLAQRCAQAARETTGLIEDAVNRSREGTQVAGEVGKSLGAIVNDASKVSGLIDAISKASDEQAQGVDQVNVAVSQMDKVTQQNAAGAEESASASEELAAQAQAVKGMVSELMAMVTRNQATTSLTAAAKPSQRAQQLHTPQGGKKIRKLKPAQVAATKLMTDADFLAIDDSSLKEF